MRRKVEDVMTTAVVVVGEQASFKQDTGAFVKHQNTIGFGLLYSFSTKP